MPRKSALLILPLFLTFCHAALASEAEDESLSLEHDTKSLYFGLETGASLGMAQSSGGSVNTFILSLAPTLFLSQKVGIGVGLHQAFAISGMSTLYFSPDIEASYSITGGLMAEREKVRINNTDVMQGYDHYSGGWRARGFFDTLFYNGSRVAGFTGLGIGLAYEFPSETSSHLSVLLRTDYVSNNNVSVSIMSLGVTYTFQY